MLRYEELDDTTRRWMMEELRAEEARAPYRDPSLSAEGRAIFPRLMEEAVLRGDEGSLARSLSPPSYWAEFEPAPQGGVRRTDPARASVVLARQEFNTIYVRGLARRLIEEGEEHCQVYLAGEEPKSCDCELYENRVFGVRLVYQGHRARYWPREDPKAFSIPCGPGCGHTIRRLPSDMKALIELESHRFGAAFRKR